MPILTLVAFCFSRCCHKSNACSSSFFLSFSVFLILLIHLYFLLSFFGAGVHAASARAQPLLYKVLCCGVSFRFLPVPFVYFSLSLSHFALTRAITSRATYSFSLCYYAVLLPSLPAGGCETRQRHGYREKGPAFVNTKLEPSISCPGRPYQSCARYVLQPQRGMCVVLLTSLIHPDLPRAQSAVALQSL